MPKQKATFQPTVRPDWAGAMEYIPEQEQVKILQAILMFPAIDLPDSAFWTKTIKPDLQNQYETMAGTSTNDENDHKTISGVLKWFVPIWVVALLGLLFVPNTKQMAMIYVVPALTESQVVKQDIPELYDLGVNALKDWLKQTKGGDNE